MAVHSPSLFLTARQILDRKVTELARNHKETPSPSPPSWVSSLKLKTKQEQTTKVKRQTGTHNSSFLMHSLDFFFFL